MPVPPAGLTANLRIDGPGEAYDAATRAAGPRAAARASGPSELVLAGPRTDVLSALVEAVTAALERGARGIDVRLEAPTESGA